jgi:uncharacterized protein
MKRNALDLIALILLIIGGLNWGLTGFGYNIIEVLLGTGIITNIIYWVVGLAALYTIYYLMKK